jgi:LysW-gamma-L-lysine carboxypeptidase
MVRGLAWAVRDVRGKPATLLRKTGTGDMNVLGAALRVPMVTYGPGDSKLDHTQDEYVDLNDYLNSISILRKGLARVLELHDRLNRK